LTNESNQNKLTFPMLAYCRWWIAWWEATSCCFVGPCCFGHSEIFHWIFKNETLAQPQTCAFKNF